MTNSESEIPQPDTSRRTFLATTDSGTLSFIIVPRHVLGGAGFVAPNDRFNIAGIGAGGMGGGDIATVARLGANVVALCNVNDERAARSFQAFPKARCYKDFRVMLACLKKKPARSMLSQSAHQITCMPSLPWRPFALASMCTVKNH